MSRPDGPFHDYTGRKAMRFRWLKLRYETGRWWFVDGVWPHFQWYWDNPFFSWTRK